MKKFKMKSEPIKPTDHLVEEIKYLIERGDSLGMAIGWAEENNLDVHNIHIEDTGSWDYPELYFIIHKKETDEEFNERVEIYNKQLKQYNKWCQSNKVQIEEVKRLKKEEEDKIRNKRIIILQKELKKLTGNK